MLSSGVKHPHDVEQIRDHRRRRCPAACARAVVEGASDRVALYNHGVHDAVDVCEEPAHRNERRMHALFNAFGGTLGNPEKLDAVAEVFSVGNVFLRERADAFLTHLFKVNGGTESNGGNERQLVRRIHPFHVKRGVSLGVARRLCGGQGFGKTHPLFPHHRENEVTRAVDDPDHPLDAVGGKTFAQGLNDRNAPGHGRFIGNNDALGAGGGEDFVAVVRQKRFVGGNDVLSGGNRGQDVAFGRFNAAHEFDRNVNFGVVYDRMPVTGHGGFGAHLGAGLLETAAHHGLHAKLHAASLRQNRRVFL